MNPTHALGIFEMDYDYLISIFHENFPLIEVMHKSRSKIADVMWVREQSESRAHVTMSAACHVPADGSN